TPLIAPSLLAIGTMFTYLAAFVAAAAVCLVLVVTMLRRFILFMFRPRDAVQT
ncbi:MAG: hypothetical protein JO128_18490, partial [Alphaproteobacteria bacterium]|nr:hypothetical protein [Alphaproteobacteria bacterium]